ncbi:hypothetical protein FRX31_035418 [Thalictrum thalictroides]|uniref:Uncharacterized protein n=1 Tax=Thalictrum thalictroides TaxID=46969 RepID=A0A7J6URX2_THATH|nr:hypothetical protein FRX31_035418 [Thalictrum thalictroides]
MSNVGNASHSFDDSAMTESRDTFEASGTTTQSVKKLKFNDHVFPIGPGSEKAATKLGKLVKTHIPISFRGRVRCVGSTISRKALLALAFARQLLEVVDIESDEWREKLNSLEESNEKILAQMNELVEGLRSGRYNHFPNQSTPSNELNNGSNNDFGSSSYSNATIIPCAIMSHTEKIVAYGTKIPIGTDRTLNGHVMQPREAKVLIDEVKDRSYAVWGGEQDGAKTLGDVKLGSFLFWHDDLLTATDDY